MAIESGTQPDGNAAAQTAWQPEVESRRDVLSRRWVLGGATGLLVLLAAVATFLTVPNLAPARVGPGRAAPPPSMIVPSAPQKEPVIADAVLGASGGVTELERCDGTFTRMVAYGATQPPVWAAHNDCDGDVILPWETGRDVTLTVDGTPATYRVVDTRDTRKKGANTGDLAGIGGDLVLQTCYYDEDRMKFIGLTPIPAAGAATTPTG